MSTPPPDAGELRLAATTVLADILESGPRPADDSTMTESARQNALVAQHQLQSQAVEVLGDFPAIVQSQWLSQALDSQSDGVRFAALLAIGRLADYQGGRLSRQFQARVQALAADGNDFLRAASAYALYKLTGQTDAIQDLPRFLERRSSDQKQDESLAPLRVQTLYLLSLMPELSPQPLLQAAMEDPNPSVQAMACARLAILGDKKALNRLVNMVQSPNADEQIDALEALAETKLEDLGPLHRCLSAARQREVKMRAAWALGRHGDRSGLRLALEWLSFRNPDKLRPEDMHRDPLHEYRVRILAALALGAIGDYQRSAGPLLEVMLTSPSKRLRLAATRAALDLLARSGQHDSGWTAPARP